MLLVFIHLFSSLNHPHVITILYTAMHQGLHILWEAGATITTARIEKLCTDTRISTNTFTHTVHVSTNPFAEIGNIIHKADSSSQHCISSILSHLGRRNIHKDDAEILQ